jgi:hypothetical protein
MKNYGLVMLLLFASMRLAAFPLSRTGTINIPNAYTLPAWMVETSGVYRTLYKENNSEYEADFAYGIQVSIFDRLEIGFTTYHDEMYYGNIKYQLVSETFNIPAVSVGVENILSEVKYFSPPEGHGSEMYNAHDYIRRSPYFVMSKSGLFMQEGSEVQTEFHFGLGTRSFAYRSTNNQYFLGFFGGISIRPIENFVLISELRGADLNLGLAWRIGNLSLNLGLLQVEDIILKEPLSVNAVMGFTLCFDTFSQAKAKEKIAHQRSAGDRYWQFLISEKEQIDNIPPEMMLKMELEELYQRKEKLEEELEEINKILQKK